MDALDDDALLEMLLSVRLPYETVARFAVAIKPPPPEGQAEEAH